MSFGTTNIRLMVAKTEKSEGIIVEMMRNFVAVHILKPEPK